MIPFVVRRAVCATIVSVAAVFPACAEVPAGGPARVPGELPEGLGYIIKDIRAYTIDRPDTQTLVPRKYLSADLHLDIMRAHWNPNIVPGLYEHATTVPKALGRVAHVTSGSLKVDIPTHGMDEIANYIKLSGADWVAVKCTSGTVSAPHWDANLVTSITSAPRSMKLYGYQTLCPGQGRAQASAVLDLFRSAQNGVPLKPHGLVIMPLGNKANTLNTAPGYFESTSTVGQTTRDYIDTLQAALVDGPSSVSLSVIYCPPAGISEAADEAVSAHKMFMEFITSDTRTRAVMPRIYWKAVTHDDKPNSGSPHVPAGDKLKKRIKETVHDYASPYLAQNKTELKLIPLGQCQYFAPWNPEVRDISSVHEFLECLAKYKRHKTEIPAVCFYAFENFTMMDHDQLAAVKKTPKKWFPVPNNGNDPPHPITEQHSEDWMPGIVPVSVMADTLRFYPAERSRVLDNRDDPNDCLPIESDARD